MKQAVLHSPGNIKKRYQRDCGSFLAHRVHTNWSGVTLLFSRFFVRCFFFGGGGYKKLKQKNKEAERTLARIKMGSCGKRFFKKVSKKII